MDAYLKLQNCYRVYMEISGFLMETLVYSSVSKHIILAI